MRVLIVQSEAELGQVWRSHLEGLPAVVHLVETADEALKKLQENSFDVIVLDLMLRDGNSLTIADFAHFYQPLANVVFVTDTTVFSDGSIFSHSANARAFVKTQTPPSDLAAIVHHYGHSADQRAEFANSQSANFI